MRQARVRKMNGTNGSVAPTPQLVCDKKTKHVTRRARPAENREGDISNRA